MQKATQSQEAPNNRLMYSVCVLYIMYLLLLLLIIILFFIFFVDTHNEGAHVCPHTEMQGSLEYIIPAMGCIAQHLRGLSEGVNP